MEDPSLLCFKNELQKKARRRVHESGYAYEKKESRSKEFGCNVTYRRPKREKINQAKREKRISQIQKDMKEVDLELNNTTDVQT